MYLEDAQKSLQTIETQDLNLTKWFDNVQITCVQDQLNYQDILTSAKLAYKKAKAEQDNLLEPLHESEKRIKDLFRPLLDKYSNAITTIGSLLNQWHKEQKQITETQILQQAKDYWDKRKDADATGEIVPLPDLNSSVSDKSKHNMGTTTYRKHIKISIVDANKIPRQYCTPSESLLRKAGELGLNVDGVVFEIEYTPVSRVAK